MKKFFISLIVAVGLLIVQVGGAFAAPAKQAFPPIEGTVCSVTLDTNSNTGITTVIVEVEETCIGESPQNVRISQQTAEKLGLVSFDADGKPVINNSALGGPVEIKLTMVIPDQEEGRHPVANALETFFSDIDGVTYGMIMTAHEQGLGFGVIAQALWMTRQFGGNSTDFLNLIDAKETGNYSKFENYLLEDGSVPMNWGQLRKAILLADKKNNNDVTLSNQNNPGNNDKDKNQDKDKGNNKDKNNNLGGNSNKP